MHPKHAPHPSSYLPSLSPSLPPLLPLLSSIISRNLLTISLSLSTFSSLNAPGPLFPSPDVLRFFRLPLITKPICSNRSISLASWPPRVNAAAPTSPDSGCLKSAIDRGWRTKASGQFLRNQKNLLEIWDVPILFPLRMTDLTSGKEVC